MRALKDIREGTPIRIESESCIHYFFRGKAKNGRVHVECYTKNHKRYSYADRYLPKNKKVEVITL